MRKNKMLGVGGLAVALLMGGCSTECVLSTAAVAVWPSVKDDALAGIESRDESDALKALRRERINQFDRAVNELGGGE